MLEDNRHCDLGMVGRGERDEPRRVDVAARRSLGGAGLAGHGDPRDLRGRARAARDDRLHHRVQLRGGLRLHHRRDRMRVGGRNRLARR